MGATGESAEEISAWGRVGAWMELARLPNLMTVPGDVVLGYLVAERTMERPSLLLGFNLAGGRFETASAIWAVSAVLLIYVFGLIDNDVADSTLDAVERPERPIPSGRISRRGASAVSFSILVVALVTASVAGMGFFCMAVFLIALVRLYNRITKRHPVLGPFNMALCRVSSLLGGFVAVGIPGRRALFEPAILVACVVWLLYFMALTMAAAEENESGHPKRGRHILLMMPFLWIFLAPLGTGALEVMAKVEEVPPSDFLGLAASGVFLFIILKNHFVLGARSAPPERTRAAIGELIRSVILLQAAGCAFLGYPYTAVAILLFWIPAWGLSKRIHSS